MSKTSAPPTLDCFVMHDNPPDLVPGRPRRDWMDATDDRYAYRCLPLTMANSTGWEILCPFPIDIAWTGGQGIEALRITSPDSAANTDALAVSHFRHGIVTFHTGYLFRTPPGWAVSASGPPNFPKHGIAPLSGLVETDWLPFPFTMNWQMTAPGMVRFERDEPFCFITLTEHNRVAETQPRLKRMDDDPSLARDYEAWSHARTDFIERLTGNETSAVSQGWQRSYMRGMMPSGEPGSEAHVTKRRMRPPK